MSVNTNKDLMDFAYAEFMGHRNAYQIRDRDEKRHASEELVVENVLDRDGVIREYGVEYYVLKIETGHAALAGEIYVPIDKDNVNIHITWKGTDDLPGVYADVAEESPAAQIYREREQFILKQINEAVGLVKANSGKPAVVHITGHSLGGAVSAMCHNSILRAQGYNLANNLINKNSKKDIEGAQQLLETNLAFTNKMLGATNAHTTQIPSELRNNLSDISELFLGTWNSACINPAVQVNSVELLHLLKDQGTKYTHRVGMVGGDAVPTLGSAQYLSGVPNSVLDQKLLKIDADVGEGYYKSLSETAALTAGGAAIGTVFGPVGTLAGAAAGFIVGGVAIAGGKTFLAHTSSQFAINTDTNQIILNRSTDKYTLYSNADIVGYKAIQDNLTFRSHTAHAFLRFREAGKALLYSKKHDEKKLLKEVPKETKPGSKAKIVNVLDLVAENHDSRSFFVNKHKHINP